jgi:hypothetical protein
MRRTEQLLTQIRRQTENQRAGVTDGISDEEFIQYLNDGQDDLLSSILAVNARAFSKIALKDLVRGQSNIALPSDVFLNSRIVLVEFSHSGLTKDFVPLKKNVTAEKRHYEGYPATYIIQGNELIISPTPDRSISNAIRITYDPLLPKLDKRRCAVSSVTISAGSITALSLSTAAPFSVGDYSLFDHICVLNIYGTIKVKGIHVTSVSAGGVVTLTGSSHVLGTGETAANGDYIVLGENASTHSQLPDDCERYLLAYGAMRIFARDSSSDLGDQLGILNDMKTTIVSNFADSSGDVDEIPVMDYSYYPEA